VGEAHLDEERLESINSVYKRQLQVHFSQDQNTPNANGVVIVISKGQLKTGNITTWEIIPGRAMILETTQHDGTPLSILGVYAPNTPGENSDFWTAIQQWFESHPRTRKLDVLGGDTNFVEDALD
jgi:exonuclease III